MQIIRFGKIPHHLRKKKSAYLGAHDAQSGALNPYPRSYHVYYRNSRAVAST